MKNISLHDLRREAIADLTESQKDDILLDLAACLQHEYKLRQNSNPLRWVSLRPLLSRLGMERAK